MCGIVGIFSPDGPIDRDALERATRCLYHRGPMDRRPGSRRTGGSVSGTRDSRSST